jgi:hypothetical protein
MPTNISWKLNVEVQAGPKVIEARIVQVDAFDRIEVAVPDTTASPGETEIDIQPGGPGNIKLLLIRSTAYGDNLKYKVHDTGADERVLNDAIFLTGKGNLDLLEGGTDPFDKLFVTNTTGNSVVLEIIVGRTAV